MADSNNAEHKEHEEEIAAHGHFLDAIARDEQDATPDAVPEEEHPRLEVPDITEMPVISTMTPFPAPVAPSESAAPATTTTAATDSANIATADTSAAKTAASASSSDFSSISAASPTDDDTFSIFDADHDLSRVPSVAAAFAPVATGTNPTGAAAQSAPPEVPLAPMKRMQGRFNPLADLPVYLVVFLGGFVGTAMRYGCALWMPKPPATTGLFAAFHPGTFVANMLATFIFATLTAAISQAVWIRKRSRQLISRGFGLGMCGGFSTFSTFMVENMEALRDGAIGSMIFYILCSFVCGLLVAALGSWIGLRITTKRAAQAIREVNLEDAPQPAIGVRVPTDPAVAGHSAEESTQHAVAAEPSAPATDVTNEVDGVLGYCPVPKTAPTQAHEPDPTTDEIPLVADPLRGEVH
ncbi:CrcB protein [Bifidobacterium dolichotidis]|uniref:Fluoride-specific ion channel FluC n=1 Tax=Bifidobacterium dolichotidis TaxID=2306976 RepID=A0A430FQW2_9BIFI|nr:CrcB family protein [Bifidobacterium dolichotidis]RSX55205.1 CrcB protein [Bifidobacterium dolichotidis]